MNPRVRFRPATSCPARKRVPPPHTLHPRGARPFLLRKYPPIRPSDRSRPYSSFQHSQLRKMARAPPRDPLVLPATPLPGAPETPHLIPVCGTVSFANLESASPAATKNAFDPTRTPPLARI